MNSGENVIQISIEDEMKLSYLDYAMSVIVGRALPDVRDGLKPVHRRVLYAMYELNNTFDRPYKKSARVVGEVIGKYHPHGDTAIYDAIVRMAQNFSMRCLLIDGQGNFGSVDGDAPAAMRYTEVRMSRFASEMLQDIDKETVNFIPNYDESLQEPFVLPTRIPNLLINGSSGIAVGMATNIPPHNLGEVVDGIVAFINEPDISIEDLTHIIKGPDFPTAGFICGIEGIKEVYNSGRGLIQLRGKMHIETPVKERENIIITEIPYQVNKTKLIEQIAELVRGKKISGIQDIRDESDRDGMRIVIELRKGESSQVITNQLFKYTQLQTTFGVIMLAIVNEQPRILNLKEILFQFIDFRREVVVRRTTFELKKAERRVHILESLKIALDHLDEVIEMIRSSESPQVARERLIEKFSFSDVQAQAILEMRLQRLTALERDKIIEEYEQTLSLISELTQILSDNRLVLDIIVKELQEIKERYG
ncbi:MAG: DNA topoisomerase (ATP-hydrolyzing), partial [Thermodesulfobacteriota bacterium]|nr:DNA topoisomerase (ATP-hydrolyzing) [Thermodesulfobacteriota bacterium]